MKELIARKLSKVIPLKESELANLIEIPPSSDLGDYSFPCFSLSKSFKKNPNEIALELAVKLESKEFEKIDVKGPYINFFINKRSLAESALKEILEKKEKYGSKKNSSKKVMIEFSQANTHKAFHMGHVRGTSLGESISRLAEFSGNRVVRANYQGDTGMHVAKWVWCYLKFHKNEKLKEDESWIAGIYVEAVKKLEENHLFQEEVDAINKKLDLKKDKTIMALWKKTRELSLKSFEKIYKELGVRFDKYYFESEMEVEAKKIVQNLLKRNIAKESEGAIIVDLEKESLGIWVLLRKDGTVLYSAKDFALAEKKFKNKLDKSIHIVGSAQSLHFRQLFKVLEMIGYDPEKLRHIPVSEVRFPWGKMSSRTGENILYSKFKTELVNEAREEIKKRHNLSNKDLEKRAEGIAIASIKYSMIKQDPNKTFIFNPQESISFEGNTGPYLLYSYARAKSILEKAKYKKKTKISIPEINNLDKSLLIALSKFPGIVKEAYDSLAPNIIANYSYSLAQIFNEFYHSEKVIGSENQEFKLALVDSFSQVLKNSLKLLGIETLDKM